LAGAANEIEWIDECHVWMMSSACQHYAGSHTEEKVLHFQVESQPVAAVTVCPDPFDLVPHGQLYHITQRYTKDK